MFLSERGFHPLQQLARKLVVVFAILVLVLGLTFPAIAQDSKLNYTYSELPNSDFSHQQLQAASFARADVRSSDFSGSDLSRAILSEGKFMDTNLSGADLTEAFMDQVNLSGANLTNAIFTDAVAPGTNFTDANIAGADFSGALLDRYQLSQLCKRASGTNAITGIETRYSLNCEN
ncbi:pentapeptide repeat protein [[Leptolyngbya] sp. PCC 7376]|uniref:pentapeptide repeat-containing protein n=1 Tax=[Leptolyngbya] sp. PCC 7376 TaxID=111781 RepID=UPI00029F1315|nr:pentapeptide repeat-containing protein [[Leptolyngbya] sp. PCC 7376]AFY36730.1 pentapeptide repeat protein [[Leptolyngbya] sp. PCC 7376]